MRITVSDLRKLIREVTVSIKQEINEKYMGFDKLKGKLSHQKGVKDPGALAASIGRKKYGKAKFQKAAAKGKKLKGK